MFSEPSTPRILSRIFCLLNSLGVIDNPLSFNIPEYEGIDNVGMYVHTRMRVQLLAISRSILTCVKLLRIRMCLYLPASVL